MEGESKFLVNILRVYLTIRELVKYPKLFFNKHLFWKKYRAGIYPNSISSYSLENERILTEHYFKDWVLKPNLEKLESDVQLIMNLKTIKYSAIRTRNIEGTDYETITNALKKGSKQTWEPLINIIEEMTFFFPTIKEFVARMISDKSGFIRETSLLVMEEGNFEFSERKSAYEQLTNDKNKKVKERVLDMIFREGKSKKHEFEHLLKNWRDNENDEKIKDQIQWAIEYER